MAFKPVDMVDPLPKGEDVRDTVVRSSLTGVAAAAIAVTIISPAGLGGLIGTSIASGVDTDDVLRPHDGAAAYPDLRTPLSQAEMNDISVRLADSVADLDRARLATDATIQQLRLLASDDVDAFAAAADVEPRAQDVELARLLLVHRQG